MTSRAIFYGRQSVGRAKDDRDGGSVSIAMQLDAASKWCAAHDATLVAHHSDVDESGAKVNRKGLDACLADIAAIRPDYVIMWDVSRLARNLKLFLDVFDRLQDAGCQIVSVTEGTKHDPFIWKLLGLMSEAQRDRVAQNITSGKREATRRGRHLGNAPLGYVRGDDGILQPDPDTRWIIEWMYQRAMEGFTPTAICRMANERGIPTSGTVRLRSPRLLDNGVDRDADVLTSGVVRGFRSGNGANATAEPAETPAFDARAVAHGAGDARQGLVGRSLAHDATSEQNLTHWSRRTVMAILRRPTYTGMVQSGESSRTTYGRALGTVTAEGQHEPIIDRGTWTAVQRTLDGLSQPSARRGSWHWLNGRVVCASCGARLYYIDTARSGGGRDRHWRCRNSYQAAWGRYNQRCPATRKRISNAIFDPMVRDALYAALTHVATPEEIIRRLESQNGSQAITARQTAERELAALMAQRLRINDAIQLGIGDLADLAQRDRALIAAIDQARADRDALPPPFTLPVVTAATDALAVMAQTRDRTPEQWAEVAAVLGLTVTVDLDAQDVTLGYRPPFDAVLG